MSVFIAPPLDFEQIREQWNKYELADGTFLKVKIVLTRVTRSAAQAGVNTPSPISADFQHISIILTNERGQPDTTVRTPQDIASHIVRDNIRFRTVEQDWSEYLTDDNVRILIQPLVMRVAKTSLFNNKGEPIYHVEIQATVQIQPPDTSSPPQQQ
ncbi:MAG: hypothetical protein ABSB40_00130 [Nitrososphaeria archaeon]|jgi:hypothetical protein